MRRAGAAPSRAGRRAAAAVLLAAAATSGVPGLGAASGLGFGPAPAAAASADATATAVLRPRHIVEGEHRRRDDRSRPRTDAAVLVRATPGPAPRLPGRPRGRAR